MNWSSGFGCHINSTFVGVLGYADDVTPISPNIRGLKQMIQICETYADEYDLNFNEKKTVAILCFCSANPYGCVLKLNGKLVHWVQEIKHQRAVLLTVGRSYVGNDVTRSTLLDRACACSYENLPKYRSYRVSNTAPWVT